MIYAKIVGDTKHLNKNVTISGKKKLSAVCLWIINLVNQDTKHESNKNNLFYSLYQSNLDLVKELMNSLSFFT